MLSLCNLSCVHITRKNEHGKREFTVVRLRVCVLFALYFLFKFGSSGSFFFSLHFIHSIHSLMHLFFILFIRWTFFSRDTHFAADSYIIFGMEILLLSLLSRSSCSHVVAITSEATRIQIFRSFYFFMLCFFYSFNHRLIR